MGPKHQRTYSLQQPMGEKSYLPALFLYCTEASPHCSSERLCSPASLQKCAFVLGLRRGLSVVDVADRHPGRLLCGKCPTCRLGSLQGLVTDPPAEAGCHQPGSKTEMVLFSNCPLSINFKAPQVHNGRSQKRLPSFDR